MLLLKHLPICSFNENIAFVNRQCTAYKVDNIQNMTYVEIHGGAVPVRAFLNIVENNRLVKPGELALNTEAFREVSLPEGARVSMVLTEKPQSLAFIHKKVYGNMLNFNEYQAIVNDIRMHQYANIDVAAFLTACHSFLTPTEAVSLIEALTKEHKLYWDEEDIVVDSCCLGNIPGSNTDLIIAAIVAAYGLPMPKMIRDGGDVSGMIRLFTDIDKKIIELQKMVKKNRVAVVNDNILPVYKTLSVLREVNHYLGIEDEIFAAIEMLAAKVSAGITHLVVDVPVGSETLVKNAQRAVYVRKFLEHVGDLLGINVDVVVTDGREPVGMGVGALLEARGVMQILHNKEDAPKDLKEKALFLAGRILEFDPKLRGGQGYNAAKEILASGRALQAFNQIIKVQGKADSTDMGRLVHDVLATNSGKVLTIDNKNIRKIGLLAGMGQYPGAGLFLIKKTGDIIARGDVLYRIYACHADGLALASSFAKGNNGYEIGKNNK